MYFVTFWVPNIVVICINMKPLLMGYVYNVCTKLLKWGCVLPLGPPTSPHSLKMFGSSYIWLGAAVSGIRWWHLLLGHDEVEFPLDSFK